ncbi:DsbA family oxidoreductase [Vibrio sp. S4M6]|uniref:DsbA family oxidoreductase n=1 Tax=Vibrio sinus TaxID=2946865 RepID=UPI002029D736|nr:DsbA family oxidoreductase [Vibrio sinus]MCL9780614.1 DsbA family oxidoreductase [Vibrio sinus]
MLKLRVDMVSDVVCPWCIIAYKRLEKALQLMAVDYELLWHPFELNPTMPLEGQNLREHVANKYGTTIEESIKAQQSITQFGQEVGFEFNFFEDMRIFNTRKAHQLLMWSLSQAKQTELELAIFDAYFTKGLDISDDKVLLDTVASLGLDTELAHQVLDEKSWGKTVSSTEKQWLDAQITAVPTIVLNRHHVISGAQSSEQMMAIIKEVAIQVH